MQKEPLGVILCSGIASRWGGKNGAPYHKALEDILGENSLTRTIHTHAVMGIRDIIVTLPENGFRQYLPTLSKTSRRWGLDISYRVMPKSKGHGIFDFAKDVSNTIVELGAYSINFNLDYHPDMGRPVIISPSDSPVLSVLEWRDMPPYYDGNKDERDSGIRFERMFDSLKKHRSAVVEGLVEYDEFGYAPVMFYSHQFRDMEFGEYRTVSNILAANINSPEERDLSEGLLLFYKDMGKRDLITQRIPRGNGPEGSY